MSHARTARPDHRNPVLPVPDDDVQRDGQMYPAHNAHRSLRTGISTTGRSPTSRQS